jgi:LuxR family transcriptional regulator, maltose regulon positive regulatory protein
MDSPALGKVQAHFHDYAMCMNKDVVLTPYEIRILQLLADGYRNAAVASELGVTESAVVFHLRNIYAKLGVHSKTQAVAVAFRLGLIE